MFDLCGAEVIVKLFYGFTCDPKGLLSVLCSKVFFFVWPVFYIFFVASTSETPRDLVKVAVDKQTMWAVLGRFGEGRQLRKVCCLSGAKRTKSSHYTLGGT